MPLQRLIYKYIKINSLFSFIALMKVARLHIGFLTALNPLQTIKRKYHSFYHRGYYVKSKKPS